MTAVFSCGAIEPSSRCIRTFMSSSDRVRPRQLGDAASSHAPEPEPLDRPPETPTPNHHVAAHDERKAPAKRRDVPAAQRLAHATVESSPRHLYPRSDSPTPKDRRSGLHILLRGSGRPGFPGRPCLGKVVRLGAEVDRHGYEAAGGDAAE